MARSRSDIANTAVRIFLQEMGMEYDRERGLEPFGKKHLNKKDLGLDAWGNIVPACGSCNSKKHANDWRDFIIERAGPNAAERHQRMQEFLNLYSYAPAYELGSVVADLYDESGAVAMALIHEKVIRTKETLQPLE
ncbi:MAG TPA: HNH endonuclease signature motif containing protein [Solirubrobacterales bacterium]|nr:HNH endonuclease signature motif containing protein [Solirubrobacterales bacterium]